MGYFDGTMTLSILTIKCSFNQRAELAISSPKLAIEVLEDRGHRETQEVNMFYCHWLIKKLLSANGLTE